MNKLVIHFTSGESIAVDADSKFNGRPTEDLDVLCGSILNRAGKTNKVKIESTSRCFYISPAQVTFIELQSEDD